MATTARPAPKISHTNARARQLAREAADRYFAALAAEIPFDNAPGDVDLITAATDIQAAIQVDTQKHPGYEEETALHAGYILGIEIGRRMAGGAR